MCPVGMSGGMQLHYQPCTILLEECVMLFFKHPHCMTHGHQTHEAQTASETEMKTLTTQALRSAHHCGPVGKGRHHVTGAMVLTTSRRTVYHP